MPIPLSNINRVRFTTQYAVDKIVRTYTGSFSAPVNVDTYYEVPHDIGKKILPEVLFSVDNISYYPSSTPMVPNIATPAFTVLTASAVSDNVIKLYAGNYSGSNRTIYYKVMLIWPI